MIDYATIYHRWKWVKEVPSRIETLGNYQLDELLALADHMMREIKRDKANLLTIHSWERVNEIQFQDEKEADAIRAAVQAEKERRFPTVTAKKEATIRGEEKQRKEPETLPSLDEAVKAAPNFLPRLWEALAGMGKPLVNRSGNYIWDGENVSVLMALSQALLTAEKISEGYTSEQVYRMLCTHFGTQAAKRPRIKAQTSTGFTNVYSDSLSEFNDIIKGL